MYYVKYYIYISQYIFIISIEILIFEKLLKKLGETAIYRCKNIYNFSLSFISMILN